MIQGFSVYLLINLILIAFNVNHFRYQAFIKIFFHIQNLNVFPIEIMIKL